MLEAKVRTLAVVAMAVVVLVITAGCSGASSSGTGTAQNKLRTVSYSGSANCAFISHSGSTYVDVCAGSSSLYGKLLAVATITFNGLNGTDTATEYDAYGSRRVKEAFTLARGANGNTISGTGTCTGGTGVYKDARCSYKLTGMTNPQTDHVSGHDHV